MLPRFVSIDGKGTTALLSNVFFVFTSIDRVAKSYDHANCTCKEHDDADEDCDFARNVHVCVTDFIVINVFISGIVSHFGPSDRSHFERLPFTNG